jgi:hypothetical protein
LSAVWRGCTCFGTTSRGEFEQIAKDDAKCAMAQWGLAIRRWHRLSNHRDQAATKKELAESKRAAALPAPSAGERRYIAVLKTSAACGLERSTLTAQ